MIELAAQTSEWWEPFNGDHVFDNAVRMVVVFFGLLLAMLSLRDAWEAVRDHQRWRTLGALSYSLMAGAPAIGTSANFGAPIYWWFVFFYVPGVVLGFVYLSATYAFAPKWWPFGWPPKKRRRKDRA